MKWSPRLGVLVVVLALLGAAAYHWLIVESHMPSTGSYAIDMAEVRQLAAAHRAQRRREFASRRSRISASPKPPSSRATAGIKPTCRSRRTN